MPESSCTFVNALCPGDLCELPYGHPFYRRHRHITGTTYGSAHTTYAEQKVILRNPEITGWDPEMHYLAPEGTTEAELVRLGWEMQQQLFPDYQDAHAQGGPNERVG